MLETLMLSRIQFAANISFHILFPSISIALCWFLFYFKLRYKGEGDDVWMRAYRFWVKVFALTFALGVVSGITMSFQFGTNWPGYMETVGNIAGPLLGYEVLTAFFLEATFLGIMLFGINRVSNRMHTLSTFIVALGTTLSAFWIIALNSWMQTPTGFEMRDGVAHAVDWWAIIFNPSMPYRLAHMLVASGLTAAFLIAGLSAYRLLKGDHKPAPRLALKTAVIAAAILIPLQILLGDFHGLNSLKYQPAKIAAVEAVWHTEKGAPLVLFAIPDKETQTNRFALEIPKLASLILTHDPDGEIKGISSFDGVHPPVTPMFYGFRIMVGVGVLMLIVAWWGAFTYWRNQEIPPLLLKIYVGMTFSGWIATLAGWYVTEIGRQPWLVTGVLATADAVTQTPAANVGTSLAIYLTLYAVLLVAYIRTLFLMAKKSVLVDRPEEIQTLQDQLLAQKP
ncbi:cytochrome ubiquinol oxidase subunit I [Cellvibrio japonicus]|uniref:Quinol oxidase, subunit I n=1 Tax=Cellvibrio japonicus (strain Ueda107) TaxID=498211 RepID=B3PEC4_CELJU|nr:cytochrome ubiquinol oxidase subunit I [Cellvibrio japonicus]ACE83984.1 quinol oxidase, subunit I [Cellvibrio japonicus Ueda107]QEI13504.1 cytochrome ubiquinol oxidase subunit I [Cellvibrio japonicus]QEI17078.1 cytochrome ubiquinol oxidase subunit I [Cellvibrio japonicus]QEI20656.1 cytochrome ubiquinol oxidase subunit I [Cellvibrio japonicus]